MRWQGRRESGNVEDRRTANAGFGIPMGGMRIPLGGRGGIGIGGIILLLIVSAIFGINPLSLLSGSGIETQSEPATDSAEMDEMKSFVSTVLADTEDTWKEILAAQGTAYEEPTLVLFSGAVESGCGFAGAAAGPFYCPEDHKVYLDLDFYNELKSRFGAPGDFAQAYVLAHEVGHHVQNLLGVMAKTQGVRRGASEEEVNAISVRTELQADCYAGIWANHADRSRGLLEAGDVEEALTAAAAVGDDTIQRRARGRVVPESFTHGSAAERMKWFKAGFEQGTLSACDTFGS